MKPFLFRCAALLAGLGFALAGCTEQQRGAGGPDQATHAANQSAALPAPASLPVSKVATITIYRPEFRSGSDMRPTVGLNGRDLVTPQRATVFTTRLLPDTYRFEVDGDKAGDLKASAGQHYYFQLILVRRGFSAAGRLGIVSPQQGKDETAHLHPIDKDDIENPAFR